MAAALQLELTASPGPSPAPQPLFSVFVPGRPISENHMYATGKGRNHYAGRRRTPEALAWQMAVWAYTIRYRPNSQQPLRLPLRIEIEVFGLRKNADPHNCHKLVLDALEDSLGINDKHFDPVTTKRGDRSRPSGAHITVWEASS